MNIKLERSITAYNGIDLHRAVVKVDDKVEFVAESYALHTLNNSLRRAGYVNLLKTQPR